MKKLVPGMFSSIPDAEFAAHTLFARAAEQNAVQEDAPGHPVKPPSSPQVPDVGGDDWLPS